MQPLREGLVQSSHHLFGFVNEENSVTNWNFFCDMIKYVPPRINRLLRQNILFSQLQYRDRVYIAAFCYQNCVSVHVVEGMLWINPSCTDRKCRKILDLYTYWSLQSQEGINRRNRYYAYDVIIGRICDLNGHIISDEISDRSR
jgi:hypothetical protein